MGPISSFNKCKTCNKGILDCPGHCGHINLATVMYNPLLFK